MSEEDQSEDRYVTKIFRKVRQSLPVTPKKVEEEKPVEAKPVPAEPMEVVEAEPIEAEPVEAVPVEPEVLGPPPPEEKKGFISQFPKIYWVANTLELFERGAYYGVLAVLSLHIITNLKVGIVTTGLLLSMFLFFSYFWPLLASALAKKFGFKNVLIVSFFLLMIGYFVTSTLRAGQFTFLVVSLILIGFGAGSFKPLISATISFVTVEKQRNLAYSLYYWFINFGAFIFPLILGFVFPSPSTWHFIFIVSGVLIIINLVIGFTMYSNPVKPESELSVASAIKTIIPALKDKKFNRLLIIYSGFWFMYAVNHSFLPHYMVGFQRMPQPGFTPQFLAVINPLVIIIAGPFLGKLVEKYKSLNVMMVGMIIYCAGVIITFLSNTEALFVTGIVVFSIGEFVTHPGFISYVSKIAPKDKVAVYMGAVFLSTGVGITTGPAVMGLWYDYFALAASRPKVFGAAIAGVGFLTIACLILYNRWINRLNKQEDPTFKEDTSIWVKVSTSAVALMFIPIIIGVGYIGGTNIYYGIGEDDDITTDIDWAKDYVVISGSQISLSGYAAENSDTTEVIDISETNIISMNFTLTWTDEPDQQNFLRVYENDPDSFALRVETPDNRTLREGPEFNAHGEQGEIILTVPFTPDEDPYLNGTGSFNVIIECGECGDSFTQGLIGFTDSGNDWELTVDYEYYQKKE